MNSTSTHESESESRPQPQSAAQSTQPQPEPAPFAATAFLEVFPYDAWNSWLGMRAPLFMCLCVFSLCVFVRCVTRAVRINTYAKEAALPLPQTN